ncbi:MAG: hypothetical protein LH649_18235 [Pseudanabaena sp. CAN_BIN31]|nr:hypothetical protein [Pseudanabaena sp. CAN_BIN31]
MSESIKAIRATVAVGDLTVDAFMLPSGEYRMSQAGAAAAIADAPVYALRFLKTNDSKLLLGQAFTDYNPDVIEVESEPDVRGQTRTNALLSLLNPQGLDPYVLSDGDRTNNKGEKTK